MLKWLGRDYELTGNEHAKDVMIEASESLVDRYHEGVSLSCHYTTPLRARSTTDVLA